MSDKFELLVEKEEMWARMLMEVLEDNEIPCVARPVYGAGMVAWTGKQERLQVYVAAGNLEQAKELVKELFAEE